MTSVLGRPNVQREAPDRSAKPFERQLPAAVGTRRPLLVVGSVVVIVASIVAFVSIYAGSNHDISVLTVVRPVASGDQITPADLGEDDLSSKGSVSVIPASQASDVIGRVAAVPLVPGSLLVTSEVTDGHPIASGDAVVGIALKDGQLPASGLQSGDDVMVVQTAPPGASVPATPTSGAGLSNGSQGAGAQPAEPATSATGASTGVLVPSAVVTAVAQPSSGSSGSETELVSVEVSGTLAAGVSVAAAADQVSLVLLPQGGQGS
jgi:hypothetical protein